MIRKSAFMLGALLIAVLIFAGSVAAQTGNGLEEKLQKIEQGLIDAKKIEPLKDRGKKLSELEKQLKEINGDSISGPQRHYAMLLQALIGASRDDDPISNTKYAAAGQLRKLIALAGPGALIGQPVRGWPDDYLKRAYSEYTVIAEAIDKGNSSKTTYKILDFLVRVTGSVPHYSYWLAIIFVTLIVKIITTPLSHLQFESMRNLQRIQPKIEKLKKELADDPREMQRQQWQLMKDHNASPQWGCLALLVQMPFLLILYQMIRAYEFQFAKGTFLWIGSGLADSFKFVGSSLADPDWPLLLLYGFSMYVSTKMSSPALDKAQADQQRIMSIMMPAMFVFIFNYFPSAFILYWLTLNILTTTQQYFMLKKPVPALAMDDDENDVSTVPQAESSVGRSPRPRKRK